MPNINWWMNASLAENLHHSALRKQLLCRSLPLLPGRSSSIVYASTEKDKGKTILIIGGAGGVGSIAIQLAKKIAGLKVITTASRPETIAMG